MTQLPAAPTEWPPDTMKVRGRLRVVWLALWLAGAAGCVALGIYEDTPESPHEWWWLPLFLLLAAVAVVLAVRSFGLGVDADGTVWSSGTRFGPGRFPGAISPPSSSKGSTQTRSPTFTTSSSSTVMTDRGSPPRYPAVE